MPYQAASPPSSRADPQVSQEREIGHDQASPTAVVVAWRDPEQTGRLSADEVIGITLRNNREDIGLKVRVTLFAIGLDQRERTKNLGRFDLARGEIRSLGVRVSELPIKSVGTTSSTFLKAEVVSGLGQFGKTVPGLPVPRRGRSVRVWSSTLYYEFEPGYRAAILHGSRGPDYQIGEAQNRAGFLRAAQPATQKLFDLRGRVERNGRPVDVRNLRQPVSGSPRIGGSVPLIGVNPQALSNPPPGGGVTPGHDRSNSYYICSHWKASYQDAGYGEDFLNSTQTMDVKARYAHFALTDQQNKEIASGYLNFQGCSKAYKLTPGKYIFFQDGSHKNGGKQINVVYKANQAQVIATAFTVMPVPTVQKVTLKPAIIGEVTRAAAVVSQILFTNDAGLQSTTYEVRAAEPCPSVGTCASGQTVKIGKNGQGVSDTLAKFVIAHEIGHTVQFASMGIPKNDYNDNGSSVPMCRCDHVQIENKLHCLQSREFISAAQVEGFAQFYASKIFNKPSSSECWFAYYKEVLFGELVINPPVQVACEFKVTWINQCPDSDRGVEWDWMTFLWKINTALANQRTTVSDLAEIYKIACGGKCSSSSNVAWNQLKNAAKSYFGQHSPKYLFFVDAATQHSVNH